MKTIQYMGSKKNLLYFLENSINDYLKKYNHKNIKIFYDAFSGSGRVAYHFSKKYKIISSDKQIFTKVINDAYLNNNIPNNIINNYINILNNIDFNQYFEKTDKWFTKNYSSNFNNGSSIGEDGKQKIWLKKNSIKIDCIRTYIDNIDYKNNKILKSVLLLSLILAINKISNVMGHQNGYLKKWSKNSKKDLILENPNTFSKNVNSINLVGDIFDILPTIKADIIYFDPPYGTNNKNLVVATRYSSFYHLWNTIVENNRPILFGKANKPNYTKGFTNDLEKNKTEIIIKQFKKLINLSNSKIISFSYSNQGLLTLEEFFKIFKDMNCKNIELYQYNHKMNTQTRTAKKEGKYIDRDIEKSLIEYFFLFEK